MSFISESQCQVPYKIFFKSSKSKTVLIWHCINLLYIASESLNDALTEVNFFNTSDTKKKTLETTMQELENKKYYDEVKKTIKRISSLKEMISPFG